MWSRNWEKWLSRWSGERTCSKTWETAGKHVYPRPFIPHSLIIQLFQTLSARGFASLVAGNTPPPPQFFSRNPPCLMYAPEDPVPEGRCMCRIQQLQAHVGRFTFASRNRSRANGQGAMNPGGKRHPLPCLLRRGAWRRGCSVSALMSHDGRVLREDPAVGDGDAVATTPIRCRICPLERRERSEARS